MKHASDLLSLVLFCVVAFAFMTYLGIVDYLDARKDTAGTDAEGA